MILSPFDLEIKTKSKQGSVLFILLLRVCVGINWRLHFPWWDIQDVEWPATDLNVACNADRETESLLDSLLLMMVKFACGSWSYWGDATGALVVDGSWELRKAVWPAEWEVAIWPTVWTPYCKERTRRAAQLGISPCVVEPDLLFFEKKIVLLSAKISTCFQATPEYCSRILRTHSDIFIRSCLPVDLFVVANETLSLFMTLQCCSFRGISSQLVHNESASACIEQQKVQRNMELFFDLFSNIEQRNGKKKGESPWVVYTTYACWRKIGRLQMVALCLLLFSLTPRLILSAEW